MYKLFFGSTSATISTILVVVFGLLFGFFLAKRSTINHWGLLVLCVFLIGLFMSIMSGMRDGIAGTSPLFPASGWISIVLSIGGALAFLIAIITLFVRKQDFWQLSFFMLSGIIIVKTIIVELSRIIMLIKK